MRVTVIASEPTPKQKVQRLWPEAWAKRDENGTWQIWRLSAWRPHLLGSGKSARLAWRDAAKDLS